jgi:hypothetical protein
LTVFTVCVDPMTARYVQKRDEAASTLNKFQLSKISAKTNIDSIDQIWWEERMIEFFLQNSDKQTGWIKMLFWALK